MSDQNPSDREERKREYNRNAQREFRRRRKEHLKNLEQLQREHSSEQSDEVERLRAENSQLRRENESLRTQVYGSSSSSGYAPAPMAPSRRQSARSYSTSPAPSTYETGIHSLSEQMMSAVSQPGQVLSQQSMHLAPAQLDELQVSPHSSPGEDVSTRYEPSLQQKISQSIEHDAMINMPSYSHRMVVMVPYDKAKAKNYLHELFRPMLSNPSILSTSMEHLASLASLEESLPTALKPTKTQMETPHHYLIDLIPSPSLRDRLINIGPEVAKGFVNEVMGGMITDTADFGQLVIWGEDMLNEASWEFSQDTLQRWGWLLGRGWVVRANFWRRQREAPPLPEW
ncbi:MAG: hypothetical protein M1837_006481 [Sclerophora amabilis]|nr:MAG: hypothetical protein M1837_006481 [Sclerophora amabilis]